MQNLGTDLTNNKPPLTLRNSPQLAEFIKHRNISLPQPNPISQQRKKNFNLQSIRFLADSFANLDKAQSQKQNVTLGQRQVIKIKNFNHQLIPEKTPFANATNTKPDKSYSIKPSKLITQHRRELSQKLQNQHQKSPKLSQRSKALCEKLCQKKMLGFKQEKPKKLASIRIHLSSSKEKENNINITNKAVSLSQQKQANLAGSSQRPQEKSQSFPQIDQDMANKLVTNRQKSCHSFMIRKKINSTVLQDQQNQKQTKQTKQTNKSVHWSKSYRKDKFSRDQNLQVSASPKPICQKAQAQQFATKTQVKQQIAQQINLNFMIQSEQGITKIESLKGGKSLKMRKNKFSKPQQDLADYQQILTEPDKLQTSGKSGLKFNNTVEENTQFKKIHTIQYEKSLFQQSLSLFRKVTTQNKLEAEEQKNSLEQYKKQAYMNQLYEMAQNKVPFKSIQNQQMIVSNNNNHELISSKNIKVCKKRVTSIRALRNLYRNLDIQDKSQLAESRNVDFSKKKQRQAPCLTHKIRWGNQTKRKQSQQNLLNQVNLAQSDQKQKQIPLQQQQKIKNPQNKLKSKKKIRFLDDQMEVDRTEMFMMKKNSIQRKSSQSGYQKSQNSKPHQTIGSRSMIMFDDPGISIIVKKNSLLQSSAHVLTTIECNIQPNQCNEDLSKEKLSASCRRRQDTNAFQNPRMQSLKELFLELRSHKSIELEEC